MADVSIPDSLHYSEQDEWARLEGEEVVVGITDFAQQQLGDIVFVTLPEVGSEVSRGEPFGEIDSVKTATELYSPVDGEVVALNEGLADKPELVNEDCYGEGWMIRVAVKNGAVEGLLDSAAYARSVEERDE